MQMMACDSGCPGVSAQFGGWKHILPAPLARGVEVFPGQCEGEIDPSKTVFEVSPVDEPHLFEVPLKGLPNRLREHGDPVLLPLTVPDGDLAIGEVDVFDPKSEAFHQPQPRPIEKGRHDPKDSVEAGENAPNLVPCEDDRKPAGSFGPFDVVDPAEVFLEHVAVKEQDGAERLILGGGRHPFFHSQIAQESADLGFSHFRWVLLVVEENEPLDPMDVSLFGAIAHVPDTKRSPDLVEKFRLFHGISPGMSTRGFRQGPFSRAALDGGGRPAPFVRTRVDQLGGAADGGNLKRRKIGKWRSEVGAMLWILPHSKNLQLFIQL